MQVIDLSGTWQVRDNQGEFELAASVPGCVQMDLLREGYLPDPWFRDNEKNWHWGFMAPAASLQHLRNPPHHRLHNPKAAHPFTAKLLPQRHSPLELTAQQI